MFDRGVLFVGSGGVGLGVLAEAMALDALRAAHGAMPLRVYSATMNETAQTDPVLLRAMQRLKLDTRGLSLKPLALYAFAGAPRIDHIVTLDATIPPATRLALGEKAELRPWRVGAGDLARGTPGERYTRYIGLAARLRPEVDALVAELGALDAMEPAFIAHSA